MNKAVNQVKKWGKELQSRAAFLYHRRRLPAGMTLPGYQEYLDVQLRRTLAKSDQTLQPRTRLMVDRVADVVDLAACSVLCIGCRNVAELDYFRAKGATAVTGIDLYSERPEILVMDMHHLEFADGRFDVIYSSHSLEHAYDVQRVAAEIVRVAKPDALVAIEVPIRYNTRGADLVDFGSAANLLATFGNHVAQVVWSDEQAAGSPLNNGGTAVARVLFMVAK